jgi:hypothetical protein
LLLSTTQILYDQPATSSEELERRAREQQLDFRWTPAQDNAAVTQYRVLRNSEVIATIDEASLERGARTLSWTWVTDDTSGTYVIEAGDAAGNWSSEGPSMVWRRGGVGRLGTGEGGPGR